MSIETITYRSSEIRYVPKFFHGEFSAQLDYLERRYGSDAVRRYLWQFVRTFHAPLIRAISEQGLTALKEYLEKVYAIEGFAVSLKYTEDELIVTVPECPAVSYMRARGIVPAASYFETTRTVNEALVAGTPFAAEVVTYDPTTGASVQRFHRRSA